MDNLIFKLRNLDIFSGQLEARQKLTTCGELIAIDEIEQRVSVKDKNSQVQKLSFYELLLLLTNRKTQPLAENKLVSIAIVLVILSKYKSNCKARGKLEPELVNVIVKQAFQLVDSLSDFEATAVKNSTKKRRSSKNKEANDSFTVENFNSDFALLTEIAAKVDTDFTTKPELLLDPSFYIQHAFDLNSLLTDLLEIYAYESAFLDNETGVIGIKDEPLQEIKYLGKYYREQNIFLPFLTTLQSECLLNLKSRYNLFDDPEYQELKQLFLNYQDLLSLYSQKVISKAELRNYFSPQSFADLVLVSVRLEYFKYFQQLVTVMRLLEQEFILLDDNRLQLKDQTINTTLDYSCICTSEASNACGIKKDQFISQLPLSFSSLLDYYAEVFGKFIATQDYEIFVRSSVRLIMNKINPCLKEIMPQSQKLTFNDIAVATQLSVLIRFWRKFGHSPGFKERLWQIFTESYSGEFPLAPEQITELTELLEDWRLDLNQDLTYLRLFLATQEQLQQTEVQDLIDSYLLLVVNLLTKLGQAIGEVPIGALVYQGEIIALATNLARNLPQATAHAEILAINKACTHLQNERLTEALLVVSLEPCTMCSGAISHARIPRVLYPQADYKAGAFGGKYNVFSQQIGFAPLIDFKEELNFQASLTEYFTQGRWQQKQHKLAQKQQLFRFTETYLKANNLLAKDLSQVVARLLNNN